MTQTRSMRRPRLRRFPSVVDRSSHSGRPRNHAGVHHGPANRARRMAASSTGTARSCNTSDAITRATTLRSWTKPSGRLPANQAVPRIMSNLPKRSARPLVKGYPHSSPECRFLDDRF